MRKPVWVANQILRFSSWKTLSDYFVNRPVPSKVVERIGLEMYLSVGDGSQLFLSAGSYMEVPEPTAPALLGLGGFAVLFHRRKS